MALGLVLALVLLEPLASPVVFPRLQLQVLRAREVASKGCPQVLVQPQARAQAQKQQVTTEREEDRVDQGAH